MNHLFVFFFLSFFLFLSFLLSAPLFSSHLLPTSPIPLLHPLSTLFTNCFSLFLPKSSPPLLLYFLFTMRLVGRREKENFYRDLILFFFLIYFSLGFTLSPIQPRPPQQPHHYRQPHPHHHQHQQQQHQYHQQKPGGSF